MILELKLGSSCIDCNNCSNSSDWKIWSPGSGGISLLAPFTASEDSSGFQVQPSEGQIMEPLPKGYSRFAASAKSFSSRNPSLRLELLKKSRALALDNTFSLSIKLFRSPVSTY
uniref:Uncharacterized protein n=1 Tax=Arundo donax TaxID=35708 RepID=A0A0A9CKS6_ARUDO